MTITGNLGCFSTIFDSISKPSMPGIRISLIITSGTDEFISDKSDSASLNISTCMPERDNALSSTHLMDLSSSTIHT